MQEAPWTYVYYPTTSTYIGVNDNNLVSVMGGTFGSQPSDIDTLDNLLSQMETESTTTDDSPNPVSTKDEVLPYFLDLSGGEVARAAATQASLILILNSPIATEGQPVIPKRLEKTDSLNSCLSGTRSFTHNLPNSYIRLYDAGAENLKGKYDFNLIANQCNLDGFGNAYIQGQIIGNAYIDGQIEGSTEVITNNSAISRTKYINYVEPIPTPISVEDLKKEIIYVTGSRSSKWIYSGENNENTDIHSQIPFDIYRNNSQAEFILKNFVVKGKEIEGVRTIEKLNYNATWTINRTNFGKQLVDYTRLVPIKDYTMKETLPIGNYDLSVRVSSPLIYRARHLSSKELASPSIITSYYPSEGTIKISLTSHNIEAEITYHHGYANVTYTRDGSIERVTAPNY